VVFLDLRFTKQQLKVGGGFVYNISLFTFESSIVPSLITLYLNINNLFPIETIMGNAPKDENHT
jgi:hypothetical protein